MVEIQQKGAPITHTFDGYAETLNNLIPANYKKYFSPNPSAAKTIIDERRELLDNLLDSQTDVFMAGGQIFKKKSYWRKVLVALNISLQKIEEWKEADKTGNITYFFTYRAILPTGQFADSTGACTQNEEHINRTIHDTRATAETRAKNRAISDLLAFGEVSAEEISQNRDTHYTEKVSSPAPSAPSPSDEIEAYKTIQSLQEVLPGSAQKLLYDEVHKLHTADETRVIVKKVIAQELSEIDKQGHMSLKDMKALCKERFGIAGFNELPVADAVSLLKEVQSRITAI
jgi:hypothetical protein